MPGVYREKECPTCGVKHRKKGQFCSKTCSNKGRDPSVYQKHSDYMRNTDKGQELTYNVRADETKDPIMAGGSNITSKPDGFVSGGLFWTSE